jgi:hypothetical protein
VDCTILEPKERGCVKYYKKVVIYVVLNIGTNRRVVRPLKMRILGGGGVVNEHILHNA